MISLYLTELFESWRDLITVFQNSTSSHIYRYIHNRTPFVFLVSLQVNRFALLEKDFWNLYPSINFLEWLLSIIKTDIHVFRYEILTRVDCLSSVLSLTIRHEAEYRLNIFERYVPIAHLSFITHDAQAEKIISKKFLSVLFPLFRLKTVTFSMIITLALMWSDGSN